MTANPLGNKVGGFVPRDQNPEQHRIVSSQQQTQYARPKMSEIEEVKGAPMQINTPSPKSTGGYE